MINKTKNNKNTIIIVSILGIIFIFCVCIILSTLFISSIGDGTESNIKTPTSTASTTLYDEIMTNKDTMTDIQWDDYVKGLIGRRIHIEGKVRTVETNGEILVDVHDSGLFDIIFLQGVAKNIAITYDEDEIIIFDATITDFNNFLGTSLYLNKVIFFDIASVTLIPIPTNSPYPTIEEEPFTPLAEVGWIIFKDYDSYNGNGKGLKIYMGELKTYIFEIIGGGLCPSMPSGQGYLVKYPEGNIEWKDRRAMEESALYVENDANSIVLRDWKVYYNCP